MENEEQNKMSSPSDDKTTTPDPLKRRAQGVMAAVGGAIIFIVIKSLLSPHQMNDAATSALRDEVSSQRISNMSAELHKINDTFFAAEKTIDQSNLMGSLPVLEQEANLCSERQPLIDSIYGPVDRLLDKLSQPDNHSSEIDLYQALLSNFRSQTEQSSELHSLVHALQKNKNARNKMAADQDPAVQAHFKRLQIIDAELTQSMSDMKDAQRQN